MAEIVKLSVITPNKEFYKGEIAQLNTESVEGQIGILPEHLPLVAILKPTISEFVDEKGERKKFFSSSGILKVMENEIIMLCDTCEWPNEIDIDRAEKSKARAEKRLNEKSDIDVERAKLSLLRSLMRIKTKEVK
ncbi:F0F1 ATP synthase subunit epsilon [Clostridium sp. MB40-C1]|uniref:F0F1 ATP synthase subunit epsilon n=1 Tax=Clostridium sp. MB40-C1 TaxID=3070996 RepID=UPI0027E1143F|nr:F0F1 ATP synthase subunit epsilon [Clostridium sp. MB40-C1]WMJ79668.1 F0F1 ATP synthase subunit epsilon [Clostridium sp. MB40-C1]